MSKPNAKDSGGAVNGCDPGTVQDPGPVPSIGIQDEVVSASVGGEVAINMGPGDKRPGNGTKPQGGIDPQGQGGQHSITGIGENNNGRAGHAEVGGASTVARYPDEGEDNQASATTKNYATQDKADQNGAHGLSKRSNAGTNNQDAAAHQECDVIDSSTTNAISSPSVPASISITDGIPRCLPPGAYRVAGRYIRGVDGENDDEQAANNTSESEHDETVFEGFLPEPTPKDLHERQVKEMLESAITLDESAVRAIDGTRVRGSNDSVGQDEDSDSKPPEEGASKRCLKSVSIILFTGLLLSAIALGVASGGSGNNSGQSQSSVQSCREDFKDRYERAKSIASHMTSVETLENTVSPQNMALEWIVCEDNISSKLIDERDPYTGLLPTQANGFRNGGDSGEAQVLRRYALATFFFATSEQRSWNEKWNFLSPDKHECSWHQNKTRNAFGYGDGGFDPAGFVCFHPNREVGGLHQTGFILDDAEIEIGEVHLNFRIPNNLTGTLPPEFVHLPLTVIRLENQKGLYGSIPSTIGNMVNLNSFSILFSGPEFGGVIPSSLFTIPAMEWITITHNEGDWEFPTSIESGQENKIKGLKLKSNGLSGTIPPFISEFTNIKELGLAHNSLEGSIPDSFGRLTSLEYFDFHDNNLNGTLPQSLEQLTNMTCMSLGKNKVQGPLPSWLGNLSKLRLLDLSYNKLEGSIPTSLSLLSNLQHVTLQHNNDLYGSISAFEPLEKLSTLLLSSNSFSSTIPSGLFSDFTGKVFADFSHNNFTGGLLLFSWFFLQVILQSWGMILVLMP
mmetsp:Transcript_12582/g.27309  ORF Transcript_12582/g.27309 Transcript_12582/m.27309 type:complete len:794 (+) Transcript_12582:236-2617(+)